MLLGSELYKIIKLSTSTSRNFRLKNGTNDLVLGTFFKFPYLLKFSVLICLFSSCRKKTNVGKEKKMYEFTINRQKIRTELFYQVEKRK